jgi:TetR/AcrR family transcriptional regulator, transcriptional repressor of aconitase
MSPRLDAAERRAAIVRAALPLFARKGFATTTTKEIAGAAGVSEALIFKHFPSKAALYDAIVRAGCEGSEELEAFSRREPSTALLVELVRCMVHYFVIEVAADQHQWKAQHRLVLSSLLEDGEFARRAYGWIREAVLPIFKASLAAAEAAGDIVPSPVSPENRFFFAEHLASMLASARLPAGEAIAGQAETPEDLVRQATWFALRGIGFRDEALARAEHQISVS